MSNKPLKDWTDFDLSDEQTYQNAPGCHTFSVCTYCKKRWSRGSAPCVECIDKELKRRELSDE